MLKIENKVLVVDDDPGVLKLVTAALEEADYQIVTAADGKEGLDKLSMMIPRLVFLDLEMPHLDGYSFVRHVKHQENTRDIPIVVITANIVIKDQFFLQNIKKILYKPLDKASIIEIVQKYCPKE